MATLSMELHKVTTWLNHANNASECCKNVDSRPLSLKLRYVLNSSARQISLVHCGSLKREPTKLHDLILGGQVNALSYAVMSATRVQQKRHLDVGNLSSTLNFLKQSHPQHEIHNVCAIEGNFFCYESEYKSNLKTSLKKLKRLDMFLMRDVDAALHSVLLPKDNQTTRMIPGFLPMYNSWFSMHDLINLKRPTNYTSLLVTNPCSNSPKAKKWELNVGVGEALPAKYQDDDPLKQLQQRRCGILLHPTSLPGSHGIGDLGKDAYEFLDWLKETGCTVWQILPLVPPGRRGGEDGSPYAGADANCGNTLLISLDELVKDGLLDKADLPEPVPVKRMNSSKVAAAKDPLILKAATKLVTLTSGNLKEDLEKFRNDPRISVWLEDAALFAAIDQSSKANTWWTWPIQLRDRDPTAIKAARAEHKTYIDNFIAAQFLFQRQWQAIHKYANAAGIKILGDMPIYIGGHSADVWTHRSLFELDPKFGVPTSVSGVPPDAFSATGQLWGSPLYNWKEMAKDKFSWWATRLKRAYELYDEFRIDHFRGFAGYWAIPATAQNAMGGKWKAGPGRAFFTAMKEAVGKIDIIAEDLGIITGDVVALRKEVNAPGMAVLQFAFGNNSRNPHLPHNHEFEQVVYPGTHDNDTCVGWWTKADDKEKKKAMSYLRFKKDTDVHWEFIRAATASVAKTTIISMQDVMGLDNNSRMNIPATQAGNWGWRVGESDVFKKLEKEKKRLRKFLCRYNRLTKEFHDKYKAEKKKKRSDSGVVGKTVGTAIDKLANNLVVQQVEKVAGKSKDKPKDKPYDKSKEKEKSKDKDFEKPKENPFVKLKEKLSEKLKDKPFEKMKDKPKDKPKDEKSKDKPKDKPKHEPNDKPNDKHGKDKPKKNK